jgi:hypothetical protein
MKQSNILLFVLFCACPATSAVLFVDLTSQNPSLPYGSWSTAATNIQDAIDAASEGDSIVVTNGVYQTGARTVTNVTSNRVAVTKAVRVESANGPFVTIIQGYQVPGATNGVSAIRCAYLTNGAILSGFNLNGGATQTTADSQGGGVWCESTNAILTNCILSGNAAGLSGGGGAFQGNLQNCVFSNNTAGARFGGGANGSILNNCTLVGNVASEGGGAYNCTLNGCLIMNNVAPGLGGQGGGALNSTLNLCALVGNYAGGSGGGSLGGELNNCSITNNSSGHDGGGSTGGRLNNCFVIGNSTGTAGGGDANSRMNNCLLYGNVSSNQAGGAYVAFLTNCTVVSNVASNQGGGTIGGFLCNSIVYYNWAPAFSNASSSMTYCCATPPVSSAFNFTNEPRFADFASGDFRLSTNSPCINAGNNLYITNTIDLAGNPRIRNGTVDLGAYETQSAGSIISYIWLQQFGLPTDGSADYADSDGDGMNNWAEWRAGTIPTN